MTGRPANESYEICGLTLQLHILSSAVSVLSAHNREQRCSNGKQRETLWYFFSWYIQVQGVLILLLISPIWVFARLQIPGWHNCDIIMGEVASQITSLTTVCSTVYSDADKIIHQKLRVTGLCAGNSPGTGEFPAQMASNAENVTISWRHHVHDKQYVE